VLRFAPVLSAGRRSTPTLALIMPAYNWRCSACSASNSAGMNACAHCGCPAVATSRQIDQARASFGPAPARQPGGQFDASSIEELSRSGLWTLLIAGPLSLWGWSESMAVAHSGLSVFFVPAFPAMLLFGEGGVLAAAPEWAFLVCASIFQFGTYFAVIHLIRGAWRTRRGR
jgi:hypothetical protein